MGLLFSQKKENEENTQNDSEENIIIDLKITDGTQKTKSYKCSIKESLETYIKIFFDEFKLNYPSFLVLYDGNSFFGEVLKKPISEIIKGQDKKDKKMTLLLYENSASDIHDQDEIIIVVFVESAIKHELKGIKGQTIEDIIRGCSKIKIDLKWCIFKYKENNIDISKKFDEIANDEDKKKSNDNNCFKLYYSTKCKLCKQREQWNQNYSM